MLLLLLPQTVQISRTATGGTSKDVPLHTVPLAQAASISSSFLAVATSQRSAIAQELASTERLLNWGVLPSNTGSEYGRLTASDCLSSTH
jgi:hypothetical protein